MARRFGTGRLRVDTADLQLRAADLHLLQLAEDLLRHAFRQVDEAVILADVDVPDVLAVEPRLVGDSPDDIARQDAVRVAHLDAERLHRRAVAGLALAARRPLFRLEPRGSRPLAAVVARRFGTFAALARRSSFLANPAV